MFQNEDGRKPLPGDAVRIKMNRSCPKLKIGSLGIIEGFVGRSCCEYDVMFNADKVFRDKNVVDASGGLDVPDIKAVQLKITDDILEQHFWCWKDEQHHQSIDYQQEVPVWEIRL